jgi:hypothetical protein
MAARQFLFGDSQTFCAPRFRPIAAATPSDFNRSCFDLNCIEGSLRPQPVAPRSREDGVERVPRSILSAASSRAVIGVRPARGRNRIASGAGQRDAAARSRPTTRARLRAGAPCDRTGLAGGQAIRLRTQGRPDGALGVATRAAAAARGWWHLSRAGRGGAARRRSGRGHRREEREVPTRAVRRTAASVCDPTARLVEAQELRFDRSMLQAPSTREPSEPCCSQACRESVRSRMWPSISSLPSRACQRITSTLASKT